MPGVNVTTATRSGPVAPLRAASGQAFFIGQTERGPSNVAVRLRSLADYNTNFGARVTYGFLYDTVKTFFEEGGEQCYIGRLVGPAATKGTITVSDKAGTPLATLKFDAASEGAWSSNLRVVIAAGSLANTYKASVELPAGNTVESYDNLTSPADAVTKFSTSVYVRVTNLGSATVAPNNNPAVGTYTVTAGNDDRASISGTQHSAALDLFTQGLGDGSVSAPGLGSATHAPLIAHAKVNRRVALLSLNETNTEADLRSTAASLDTEYAGLFGPWVYVSDSAGGRRSAPPEGYVAGVRARAHSRVGAWRAPAGEIATARSIIGLVNEWPRTITDSLNASRVNAIRLIAGSLRLYGWRSLSQDTTNYYFLSARDLLNRLVVQAESELEEFVFASIDGKGQVLSSIEAQLIGILEPIRAAGGLYERRTDNGDFLDPGYSVNAGASVNTPQSLSTNTINAEMLVRVSPTGENINLTITKVGLLSGV